MRQGITIPHRCCGGPLCFAIHIPGIYKSIKLDYDNHGYKGSVDWEIRPAADWNWGIILDRSNPGNGFVAEEHPVTEYPFADPGRYDMVVQIQQGMSSGMNRPRSYWKAGGFRIPEWGMKNNSADLPPVSPVKPCRVSRGGNPLPYGSAKR
ncbi:MAG: hypothetical protein MZV63_37070 [Marinilabiliales bacterium]|nr:hypothetical protein [Marinilabiliales bacterium]